jgi:hypothetical protein
MYTQITKKSSRSSRVPVFRILGAFPALRAGNRAIRFNSSQTAHAVCSGISASIPCAAKKRHPCRFFALSFCKAKTHEFRVAGIHAGLDRLGGYARPAALARKLFNLA